MMKKPTPINKEIPFEFDELFFSTTDHRGIIQYGNDVFVRISGYTAETILGAPHNIIRHPDMPKAVFKLFWDTLKTNNPIAAYVKNLSADGRYYWVFAFAFPVTDGYLSIRFKPSSPIFEKIQAVYADLLQYEKDHSIEESEAYLMKFITELGFENYRGFMINAAITELNSRDKMLRSDKKDLSDLAKTQNISDITLSTSKELNASFNKISIFQNGNSFFERSGNLLKEEFLKLKYLSINMKILAGNIGDQASTLGVISHEFSNLANKIEHEIETFSNFVNELSSVIEKSSLHLTALKTQMIMVDFFVKESIHKLESSDNAFEGMLANRDVFEHLFSSSIEHLNQESDLLLKRLGLITTQIKDIQKLISGLEVIKQTGAIESARKDEIKKSFDFYLTEMDHFNAFLRTTILELNQHREILLQATTGITESSRMVSGNIHELFELAIKTN